jgi:hypothetical protein
VVVLYPEQLPGYRDPWKNWAGLVNGNLQARAIAGNHEGMLLEPGLGDLAAKMSECMAVINPKPGAPFGSEQQVSGVGRPNKFPVTVYKAAESDSSQAVEPTEKVTIP